MTSERPNSARRSWTRTYRTGGLVSVLLGFVTYQAGRAFDGGFVSGMFDGATIALMIMGAYLIGASTWHARRSEQDLDEGKHWLPSRDSARDEGATDEEGH